MEFSNKLKTLRKEKGISQQTLADAIFVSRSAVAKWENGLGLPSRESMAALCNFFQISEDFLHTQEPESVIVQKNKRINTILTQRIALLCTMVIIAILILPNTRVGMKMCVTLFHSPMTHHAQKCLINPDPTQFPGFSVHTYPDAGAVFYENTTLGYRGFFYSEDGNPIGFQGVEMIFYQCGKYNFYWSEAGSDNWMHLEHIIGNWYWYEMHF